MVEGLKTYKALFISDLHLHPDDKRLGELFDRFLKWATENTESLYILGDFFHAWAGDDATDAWSASIARQIKRLTQAGVACYFMPGNRDFLIGDHFSALAGWTLLPDPCVQQFGEHRVLLTHGDRYCTRDVKHQCFRRLTRGWWFRQAFLKLSLQRRQTWVNQLRRYRQLHHTQEAAYRKDVTQQAVSKDCARYHVQTVIHGHTHRPMCVQSSGSQGVYKRYVLSDWDDTPTILGYNTTLDEPFYMGDLSCHD